MNEKGFNIMTIILMQVQNGQPINGFVNMPMPSITSVLITSTNNKQKFIHKHIRNKFPAFLVSSKRISLFLGGFPIEIKTKIIYHIILLLSYEIMITTNFMISYFGFNFDRKSTSWPVCCYLVAYTLKAVLRVPLPTSGDAQFNLGYGASRSSLQIDVERKRSRGSYPFTFYYSSYSYRILKKFSSFLENVCVLCILFTIQTTF